VLLLWRVHMASRKNMYLRFVGRSSMGRLTRTSLFASLLSVFNIEKRVRGRVDIFLLNWISLGVMGAGVNMKPGAVEDAVAGEEVESIWEGEVWEEEVWEGEVWEGEVWEGEVWEGEVWEGKVWEGEVWEGEVWEGEAVGRKDADLNGKNVFG
jgi:hypothetical protein